MNKIHCDICNKIIKEEDELLINTGKQIDSYEVCFAIQTRQRKVWIDQKNKYQYRQDKMDVCIACIKKLVANI